MRKVKDYYFKKAKEEQYAARSVYKLKEIDSRFHCIHRDTAICDLGCSPGSWSQYMLKKIGNGFIVGIDIGKPPAIDDKRFHFIQADIFTINTSHIYTHYGKFDIITSDLSPHTSGNKFSDSQNSLRMFHQVIHISKSLLKKGGNIVAKIFQGEDLDETIQTISPLFQKVIRFKPKSSRKESREIYIVAIERQ